LDFSLAAKEGSSTCYAPLRKFHALKDSRSVLERKETVAELEIGHAMDDIICFEPTILVVLELNPAGHRPDIYQNNDEWTVPGATIGGAAVSRHAHFRRLCARN
jgi:hypothetical protein